MLVTIYASLKSKGRGGRKRSGGSEVKEISDLGGVWVCGCFGVWAVAYEHDNRHGPGACMSSENEEWAPLSEVQNVNAFASVFCSIPHKESSKRRRQGTGRRMRGCESDDRDMS